MEDSSLSHRRKLSRSIHHLRTSAWRSPCCYRLSGCDESRVLTWPRNDDILRVCARYPDIPQHLKVPPLLLIPAPEQLDVYLVGQVREFYGEDS